MALKKNVLIIGARGHVGSQVLAAVLAKQKFTVLTLIRPASNAAKVEALGATVKRGDMMDPDSLKVACEGVDVVINSANGYGQGHPEIDTVGANNVADACKAAGVKRYIYCSVLTAEKAEDVEHFHHKKVHEDYCISLGIPFIALRPGGFLDQATDYLGDGIKGGSGFAVSMWNKTVKIGMIYTPDLAELFARAIDVPDDVHQKIIDVGWSRPVAYEEVVSIVAGKLDRSISCIGIPWFLRVCVLYSVGFFKPFVAEMVKMFNYFDTGLYVNTIEEQEIYFGKAPEPEDVIGRYVDKLLADKEAEAQTT